MYNIQKTYHTIATTQYKEAVISFGCSLFCIDKSNNV